MGVVVLVILVTLLGLYWLFREQERAENNHARHYFNISGTCDRPPALDTLFAQLGALGYQPVAYRSAQDRERLVPTGISLAGVSIWLRDDRAYDQGHLLVELHTGEDQRLVGTLTGEDAGPGFYEEMAQFVVAELAEHSPDLVYWCTPSKSDERLPARELRDKLPRRPYGLGLLPS